MQDLAPKVHLMKTLNPNAICSIHGWKECTMSLYKTLEGWHREVVEILIEAMPK